MTGKIESMFSVCCLKAPILLLCLAGSHSIASAQEVTVPAPVNPGHTELSFPFAADSYFAYKSLVLFNPNDEQVNVLDVFGIDQYGAIIAQTSPLDLTPLVPGERRMMHLADIFSLDSGVVMIRLKSDKPLAGFELIYDPFQSLLETIPAVEDFAAVESTIQNDADSGENISGGLQRLSPDTRYAAVADPTLTVRKSGTGTGTVADGADIDCGSSCKASYSKSTSVILTVIEDVNSTFTSWSGCTADATDPKKCTVTLTSSKSVTAKFTIKSLPDLSMMSVTAPAKGIIGKTISVSSMVANLGTEVAENGDASKCTNDPSETNKKKCYRIQFYLSPDSKIDPASDTLLGGCNMPQLQVKATNNCYGSMKIPETFGIGRYYVGAYADANCGDDPVSCEIIEISETNNGKSASSTITIAQ